MEDGVHPSAGVVGTGGAGTTDEGVCPARPVAPPVNGIAAGARITAGAGEAATGAGGGRGPDRPLHAEQFLGDLARENAQLRDDVVLGGRDGEERPRRLAGFEVGHRRVDAVSLPELGDRPLEQQRVPSPPSPPPPGPCRPPGGAPRRRRPAPSDGRPAGAAGRKPSPRSPPSSGTRTGRWRCGGSSRRRTPGGGTPEHRKGEGRRQERRAPRVGRQWYAFGKI